MAKQTRLPTELDDRFFLQAPKPGTHPSPGESQGSSTSMLEILYDEQISTTEDVADLGYPDSLDLWGEEWSDGCHRVPIRR